MKYLFYFFILIFGTNLHAQNYNLTNTFSTKDGLPSNLVYEVVEDNNGFLWVATDNGISRFDGKRFVNYSTKNGLPSNDVINLIKQNDGTIWAICYKQAPSYFDEKRNRFVCLEYDKDVVEISNYIFTSIYSIRQNDLFFQNYSGNFTFSNGRIINKIIYTKSKIANKYFEQYLKNEIIRVKNYFPIPNKKKETEIEIYQNKKKLGAISYEDASKSKLQCNDNASFYRFYSKEFVQIKVQNLRPFQYQFTKTIVPETIKWFKFSSDKLSVISTTGTIFIYNEKSLKLDSTIKTEFNVNTAYIDKNNNAWVATVNNGLIYYTDQIIKREHYSKEVISNFLCAKVAEDGSLYAGNYQGEIVRKNGVHETKYNFGKAKENDKWIRNIHFFPHKTIVVSDLGIMENFTIKTSLYYDLKTLFNIKSSVKLNESQLILGSTAGLVKYNVNTGKYGALNFPKERILNLKRISNTTFYFSANDGLYLYDVSTNKYQLIGANNLFKNDKIQYFEPISKTKIWISTYKGNLYLIDNNRIIKQFVNDDRIPINISKLLHIDQQLWMASKSGIFILDYKNLQNVSISKLTTSDGLTSNVVNFLDYKNDTIYAATDNGVSKIPIHINPNNYDIQPQLIAIKINEKIVPLNSKYQLKSDQNNISIELSGVDITGHFKNFQYAINKNKFSNLNGNFLNLRLNSGDNTINIRVIDENNKVQQKSLKLIFDIQTPFYKSIWVWIVISILLTALLFYLYNRRKSILQNRIFAHELELEKQRQKITADLHDDLGASLSSLQINSAIAQKLLDKNPTETKKILEKIESQAKSISENIGDIIWSLKPNKDEFMSLSTRIKKITSEILGSANIHYGLLIDGSIDAEITDFSTRKNIILICKEALNNILKHSQPKEVCVTLQKSEGNYILEIADDGKGFSKDAKKGNGINNMQKRTLELGGKFEIIHEAGTKIIVSIPIIREKK